MGKPEWRAMTAYNKHAESISWQRDGKYSLLAEKTQTHTSPAVHTRKESIASIICSLSLGIRLM